MRYTMSRNMGAMHIDYCIWNTEYWKHKTQYPITSKEYPMSKEKRRMVPSVEAESSKLKAVAPLPRFEP